MATILDVSLLQTFDIVYPVLLVLVVMFALLQKTKAIGDNVGINAAVAVAVAFMVVLSRTAIEIINFMIPWFVVTFLFFMLLLLIFQIFGATEKDIASYMKTDKGVGWVIIGIAIVIAMAGFGKVLGQTAGPYLEGGNASVYDSGSGVATGSFETNVMATLFHPKVIGIMILFTIVIFAVALLTGPV